MNSIVAKNKWNICIPKLIEINSNEKLIRATPSPFHESGGLFR
jgi:hypothetical protein